MAAEGLTYRDLRSAILFAALVAVAALFIAHVMDVILMFSIVALLVTALNPPVTRMRERGVPRWLGTLIVTLAFIGILVLLAFFVVPAAARQFRQLAHDLPAQIGRLNTWIADSVQRYRLGHGGGPEISLSTIVGSATPYLGGVAKVTTGIVEIIAAAVAIFITTIYALINPEPLSSGFLNALAPEHRARAAAAGQRLALQIRAWARGTVVAMVSIFVLVYVALWLLGFKQALLFAIIAGLFEVIPVIGPIIGGVLPTLTALATEPILALWVVGSFVLIQQFENHVLIPLVMSRQVQLHPVTVIVWVFTMGALYGVVGVFLATPVAVTAGVLYDELYLCEYRGNCDGVCKEDGNEEDASVERTDRKQED